MTQQAPERRSQKLSRQEWITIFIGFGIVGVLVQVGEFKANFSNLCARVANIEIIQSAYAIENRNEHAAIKDNLAGAKIDIAALRGRQVGRQ